MRNVLLMLILPLLLFSCAEKLAVVNGETIEKDQLETIVSIRVQQYEAQGYELSDVEIQGIRQELLDGLIDQTLLRQKAEAIGMELADDIVEMQYIAFLNQFASPEEATAFLDEQGYTEERFKEDIYVDMLVQKLLEQELFPLAEPSESEIEEFYQGNPQYFSQPEQIKARHILISLAADATDEQRSSAEQQIRDVLVLAQGGDDFAQLAETFSQGPSASSGGDLGWFGRGQMVPPFEEAAFALAPGQVGGPVETQFGFHIIKVEDKRDASVSPLEEVRESIVDFLRQDDLPRLYDEYLGQLRETAAIEYMESEEPSEEEPSETQE